jgi:hypothetical protein
MRKSLTVLFAEALQSPDWCAVKLQNIWLWRQRVQSGFTFLLLIAIVACSLAALCVTRLIVKSQITDNDKCLLREWVDLVRQYPKMEKLTSCTNAARSWAKKAADEYSQQWPGRWRSMSRSITLDDCPGLTTAQAQVIRGFVWYGLCSGAAETPSWKHALAGQLFRTRDRKPSDCLNPRLLDQYPREPLMDETWGLPGPEETIASRAALERLAKNRKLLGLIDECWQIGYEAGRLLGEDW